MRMHVLKDTYLRWCYGSSHTDGGRFPAGSMPPQEGREGGGGKTWEAVWGTCKGIENFSEVVVIWTGDFDYVDIWQLFDVR